ncbi:nucleoside diphosphate kinase [Dimargaris cristalligena]|uniref:Nucleoside diphosphate kinase n=1 Tax=Dimargaris cristalligena TaxID=215637 RepID=A0A4P9ZM57_9FUNG|nr:nucleoside diphosphate kinase [Dimargaris cristalligena]|eukprot:RKP33601.1 nucleoside diphosphate kinase [Dimargaris cristalligena]
MFTRSIVSGLRQASRVAQTSRAFSTARAAGARSSGVALPLGLATVGAGAFLYYQQQQSSAALRTPSAGVKGTNQERTFIAVKPDGVQRALVGEIIKRFEARGYKLVGLKLTVPSKALAGKHYADLKGKPFFNGLVDYMTNGKAPVVAMVWEGKDVIRQGRRMLGATNPLESAPGTIRADFCTAIGRNIIHGSDSYESALKEITLWFNENELADWVSANAEWTDADN